MDFKNIYSELLWRRLVCQIIKLYLNYICKIVIDIFIDLQEQDEDEEDETLGDKLYNAFVANEDAELEIDKNDLVITKTESSNRIICIFLVLGVFLLVLLLTLSALLFQSIPQPLLEDFLQEELSMEGVWYFRNSVFIVCLFRLPKAGRSQCIFPQAQLLITVHVWRRNHCNI